MYILTGMYVLCHIGRLAQRTIDFIEWIVVYCMACKFKRGTTLEGSENCQKESAASVL
jgi:hypothetical protein